MKIELEPEDIQAIAERTLELLRPHLSAKGEQQNDMVLDVPGLCAYLQVSPRWVYERTHLKEIPFMKLSNKEVRFRKKTIDKWLDSLQTPALSDPKGRFKVMK